MQLFFVLVLACSTAISAEIRLRPGTWIQIGPAPAVAQTTVTSTTVATSVTTPSTSTTTMNTCPANCCQGACVPPPGGAGMCLANMPGMCAALQTWMMGPFLNPANPACTVAVCPACPTTAFPAAGVSCP